MAQSREQQILGALLQDRTLIEKCNIDKSFFKTGRQQLIFDELLKGAADDTVVAQRIHERSPKFDDIFTYISNCLEGVHRMTPTGLQQMVNDVKRGRLKLEIENELKKKVVDHEKVKNLYTQIESLRESNHNHKEEIATKIEELAALEIPQIDWLVEPIVERFGYTLIGAQKGVGKSLFVTQLALYAASGMSPFLNDGIRLFKPLNVLLVQQEVSLPGMKDRLFKMRSEKLFETEGRFRQITTTGTWWNLSNKKEDYQRLIRLIEEYKPDILILDPLYTFYPKELNTSGDISPMMEILAELKTNFNLGLIVVHHFSNKEDPDSQKTPVGRFMGHSMIANSADVTIGLDFLHPKYRQQNLPLAFQNYIMVEITTRHGEWPARFALERKQGCLLFEKSSIWQDLGRSIMPGQIEDLIEAHDRVMLQKDIIQAFIGDAKPTTVKKALYEAEKRGILASEIQTGKGSPVLWRLLK